VALLLPAVQAAREAARRSACANNLRQIGLAIHEYHDVYKVLPPGNINCPNHPVCSGGVNIGQPWITGWAISILPFMEQQPLFDTYNQNFPNTHAVNTPVIQTFLEPQICPSDINTKSLELPESGPGSGIRYAPGSYRAVSGVSSGAAGSANWDETNPNPQTSKGAFHVVWPNFPNVETFASILDGTANTLFVGEYHTRTINRRRTFWGYTYTSYACSSFHVGSPTAFGFPDYDLCDAAPPAGAGAHNNDCKRSFASFHPGGLNFCLGDASVRFIAKNIDRPVLYGAATVLGNEATQLP
jgi:hypothetical protein